MEKWLVTIEFRYLDAPKYDNDCCNHTKTITVGIFDDFESACISGNNVLEKDFESQFKLNKNWNKKERFSLNGGCFGKKNDLITDLAYLETPFSFFAKITKLDTTSISDTISMVVNSCNKYKDHKRKAKNDE